MAWHLVAHSNSPADLVCADCWIGYQTVLASVSIFGSGPITVTRFESPPPSYQCTVCAARPALRGSPHDEVSSERVH